MARLESQSKLGYYPTPENLIASIANRFEAPHPFRALDTSVGTGEALRDFVGYLGDAETWGVELSYSRAEKAKELLDTVLPSDFLGVKATPGSCSIVYNNPPYDYSNLKDPDTGRYVQLERLFIIRGSNFLVNGGHQVILVPRKMLADDKFVRHLAGSYKKVVIRRFPDPEYDNFRQIVIFAIGKKKYSTPKKHRMEALVACIEGEIPTLEKGGVKFKIPPTPVGKFKFEYMPVSPQAYAKIASEASPVNTNEFRRETWVRPLGSPIYPAVPEKIGHISMEISSGEIGAIKLDEMVAKGTIRKIVQVEEETKTNKEGEYKSTAVTETEQLQTQIAIIHDDGRTGLLSQRQEVADFITQHASNIADVLLERNIPTYDFKPTKHEWDVVSKVGLGLPSLPGRKEKGLFQNQKHLAIASYRVMIEHNHSVKNAEMGFGKTPTTAGVAELLDKWPMLVVCPGHMVYKWQRTLAQASNPDNPIVSRVISRPVRSTKYYIPTLDEFLAEKDSDIETLKNLTPAEKSAVRTTIRKAAKQNKDPYETPCKGLCWQSIVEYDHKKGSWWTLKVVPIIEEAGGQITSKERFQVPPVSQGDTGRRVTFVVNIPTQNGMKEVLNVVKRHFKFRSKGKRIDPSTSLVTGGLEITIVDRDDYTVADFFADYDAGVLGNKAAAVIGIEAAKYGPGINKEHPAYKTKEKWVWNPKKYREEKRLVAVCPGCGGTHVVKQKGGVPHFCAKKVQKPIIENVKRHGYGNRGEGDLVEYKEGTCGRPLFEMSRWHRQGLARLIQKKYKYRFKLYVPDEIHKAKSGGTDVGVADGRILSSIKYSLALTGTIFGGVASSLFYLYYRRSSEVRRLYGHDDINRWIDHYGLWETSWTERRGTYGRSLNTGVKRIGVRRKELPGISPAVIRYMLPITLFGKITDLGYELPPLREHVQSLPMGNDLGSQYHKVDESMLQRALDLARSSGDSGMISTWFSTIRYRPASAYRDEVATYVSKKTGGKYQFPMPAVIPLNGRLPKEKALTNILRENISKGKKTLVFVEQTGTRDIRDRLIAAMEADVPEARVATLSANSMSPARRERWIETNAPNMDIMFVNPKLVETGLDLVMFSHLVFYELPLSLYTLWQAMRRVWRLGQDQVVDCTFLTYSGTVEEALLSKMGQKLKSALLLYGDEAAGAIIESDPGDIMREMIQDALDGKSYKDLSELNEADGLVRGLFSQEGDREVVVTDSPLGSPVASSPHMPVLEVEQVGLDDIKGPAQLSMFGAPIAADELITRRRRR